MDSLQYDVVVVGGGNAALCAALSATEAGAKVAVIEKAHEEERGGNSAFTAGTMRAVYAGLDDVQRLVPDLSDAEIAETDFGSYSEDQFFDDMYRVTRYRTNPDLCEVLVRGSNEALHWLRSQGVRFIPVYGAQSFKVDGKRKFWGGVVVGAVGAGIGLVDSLYAAAQKKGIDVYYDSQALKLVREGHRIVGVQVDVNGRETEFRAGAVVLACGGFQANAEWRTRYLGPGWDLAKIRGTRFNTGDGIRMALDAGAQPYGHWSGCHATEWDLNAPDFGDRTIGDRFQKHSYQFSVMVNNDGKRFVDEGADFRNYTYAKYGREILAQPGQACWQIFDSKVFHLQRDEYHIKRVTKVKADTLEKLVDGMEGVDKKQFLKTIAEYNAAIKKDVQFNPNVLDGRGTVGLPVPKSNWANTIEDGPFEAYAVTCGVTFTFGGVKINTDAEVQNYKDQSISGLYCCGEMAGGVFYFNYPGSSGLTNGAVFGRIAGRNAANFARNK